MSQTVLVTGASLGIGEAVAKLLQTHGFTVFGTTRAQSPPQRDGIRMLTLDVDSEESVRNCMDQVLSLSGGRIDILVNNAGYALVGAAEETSIAEAKEQFETNFFGVARTTNALLPVMRRARAGKIITIGSLAGLMAVPFNAFYSATKFALEAYMEALWYELRPFGISVSLIEPGFVRTAISHASHVPAKTLGEYDEVRSRAGTAIRKAIQDGIAPELVAQAVLSAARSQAPKLRYRFGGAARWLPRLRSATPWNMFASGVRRTFALDANG